ncbi:MAG TPA: hypothetical protein VIV40_18370, partial [Kofleriaceae bacterium]
MPSCGLIDSDVTNFDLTLPDKAFSVDASGWQVNQMAADTFLAMSCSGSPSICSSAATQACPMNCTGRCGMASTCELELNISAYKPIDLVMEKPELNQINDKPVIKVTIDSVRYAVSANTLNVATPEMGVYVAPITVMDPKDPNAKQVGIIASVPAGATVATRDMTYTTDGKQTLVDTMSTYKNPFNVIVGTSKENPIVI